MGIRLEDIHPLKASPVFCGISQKDRFELLKEIDARIVELGEGQLLRRAGDKLDFYPVVIEGSVLSTMAARQGGPPVARSGRAESFAEAVPVTLKHTPVNIWRARTHAHPVHSRQAAGDVHEPACVFGAREPVGGDVEEDRRADENAVGGGRAAPVRPHPGVPAHASRRCRRSR